MHFRGIPTLPTENEPTSVIAPLCATKVTPIRGATTQALHEVTCNDCRKILRLPRLEQPDDDAARRYP